MPTTRALWLPDTTLLGWSGAGPYLAQGTTTVTAVSGYPATGLPYMFYEVSVIGSQGSWWAPVAPASPAPPWNDTTYGGSTPLASSAGIIPTSVGGQSLVRPATLFFWVPATSLSASTYVPMTWSDTVTGTFPTVAPSAIPPSEDYSITELPNGVQVNLLTPGWTTRIVGNTVKVVWQSGVPTS